LCIIRQPTLDETFIEPTIIGYRYPPQPRIDGLAGEEGAYNMCSFWLVEATRAGQADAEN
jgi:hypothetical protein